jgi:sugar phosphate isomerase/epimerase
VTIPLRPGLCSVTFRSLTPAEVIEAAVAAGIEGVEWGGDVHVPPGQDSVAADVRRRCDDAGLACPSYGSYLAAGKSSPERTAPVLATAVALGAGNVRVWCPFGARPGSDPGLFRAAAADLATWATLAADHGLTVSTEFHVDTFTETAQGTLDLLDAAGRPDNLFTYWQPVEGRPHHEEAAAVRPDVSHVHVFHWAAGGERRALGDGAAWPGLLRELGQPTRFAGDRFAFLEFVRDDAPEQLLADAVTLRTWLA